MTRSKSLRIGRISQDHPPRVPKHPRSFDLFHRWQWQRALLQFLFFYDDGYLVGLPAYSHHDRFPPWWVFVSDDNGGNLSGDKIPPLMVIIINHLTQFNSSQSLVMLLPDCINTALNSHRQKTISHLLKF